MALGRAEEAVKPAGVVQGPDIEIDIKESFDEDKQHAEFKCSCLSVDKGGWITSLGWFTIPFTVVQTITCCAKTEVLIKLFFDFFFCFFIAGHCVFLNFVFGNPEILLSIYNCNLGHGGIL